MAKAKEEFVELEKLIKKINSIYGDGTIKRGNEFPSPERISTGSIILDYLFCGGIPKGKIIEFQGPKSSGKSLVCMKIVDEYIKRNRRPVLWIDAEHSWDSQWASKHIRDLDLVFVSQIGFSEGNIDLVREALQSETPPGVIVVDSVAALSSQAEQEKSATEEQRIGQGAKLMALAMRVWTPLAARANCPIIMINQLRDDIGTFTLFGKKEVAPGGRAKEFFDSLVVEFRAGEKIKSGDEIIGQKIRVTILKSKIYGCVPYTFATIELYFQCNRPKDKCSECNRYCPEKDGYFNKRYEAFFVGKHLGLISRNGPYYQYGELKAKGEQEFLSLLTNKIIDEIARKSIEVREDEIRKKSI